MRTRNSASEGVTSSETIEPLESQRISNYETRPVKWIWPGVLPRGKLVMLAGDPGSGKSVLSLFAAATVSTGGRFPTRPKRTRQGRVLIISAEDDVSDTIRPRLEAMGADLDEIEFFDGGSFALEKNVAQLECKLQDSPLIGLVILDPMLVGGNDSRNNVVRGTLHALKVVAERQNVTILGITHLTKSASGKANALSRVLGSVAYTAVPRVTLLVAADKSDPQRKLLCVAITRLGPRSDLGYAYRIVRGDNGAAMIEWEERRVHVTPENLINGKSGKSEQDAEAEALIREIFGDDEGAWAKNIKEAADNAEIPLYRINKAKKILGITSEKQTQGWAWFLPESDDRQSQES